MASKKELHLPALLAHHHTNGTWLRTTTPFMPQGPGARSARAGRRSWPVWAGRHALRCGGSFLPRALALLLVSGPARAQTGIVYGWTNFVGMPGGAGNVDGTGSAARFYQPFAVAVDSAGTVYVADSNNYTIRKVTPTGVVTTLAGGAGQYG